jgi:hypothetical protein
MAATQFTDVVVRNMFAQYAVQQSDKVTAALTSGVAEFDQVIANLFAPGGQYHTLPFWTALSSAGANVSSSDPAQVAVAKKVTADKQVARRVDRNDHWGVSNMAKAMAGNDPFRTILQGTNLVQWTAETRQLTLMATLNGIYNDNVTEGASDMIFRAGAAGTAAALPVLPADLVGPAAIAGAEATLGDQGANLPFMICHSAVARNLKISNLMLQVNAAGVPTSVAASLAGQPWIWSEYLQKRVIVDDSCPTFTDGPRIGYVSFLLAPGFIRYAPIIPENAIEFYRKEQEGNGAGVDYMAARIAHVMHPWGYATSVLTENITDAALALAASWARVEKRRNIKLAFLVTNG